MDAYRASASSTLTMHSCSKPCRCHWAELSVSELDAGSGDARAAKFLCGSILGHQTVLRHEPQAERQSSRWLERRRAGQELRRRAPTGSFDKFESQKQRAWRAGEGLLEAHVVAIIKHKFKFNPFMGWRPKR